MKTVTRTVKTVIKTITVKNAKELLAATYPAHAQIYMAIPGGGDWSNHELMVDAETPLTIQWTETTES